MKTVFGALGIMLAAMPVAAEPATQAIDPRIKTDRAILHWDASSFITQDAAMFAVIEAVQDNEMTLRMLHSVMSRDAETILFVGDEVRVRLEPEDQRASRRAGCVTAIMGHQGQGEGRIVAGTALGPEINRGCLGHVQDFRGQAGLPPERVAPDHVVRVMLAGDMEFEGPE